MKALKDLLVTGDIFVHEIHHALPAMNTTVKMKKIDAPYIYDQYNIRCFTSNLLSNTHSVPARLVNCLIKALNEDDKIPRIITIIPDWNLLQYINFYSFGIQKIIGKVLKWMIKNIDNAVEGKKILAIQDQTRVYN